MPFEIIFFALMFNYSLFYNLKNRLFYLLCFLVSFMSKFSFLTINGEFFAVNIFSSVLFFMLVIKFLNMKYINTDFLLYNLIFLIIYQILIMKDIFYSTHFNFIYLALIIFPILRLLLKEKFITFITMFCLFSELINFIQFRNIIGFINVFSVEIIYLLIIAFCVESLFCFFKKIYNKKGVCFG